MKLVGALVSALYSAHMCGFTAAYYSLMAILQTVVVPSEVLIERTVKEPFYCLIFKTIVMFYCLFRNANACVKKKNGKSLFMAAAVLHQCGIQAPSKSNREAP